VTQFPPWSSHSPVCTITAVSKDLVRRPTRIHMILVSPPYRTNWGCLLADSGTIRREVTRPVAGRPSMFVLRSMRKHPRDFWRTFSVNHSRTGAVKLLITRRDEPVGLAPQGYRSRGLQPVPGGRNWAAIQPPLQKDDSTLRLAYSALELSPWAMPAHAVGNPGRPGRADVAPPRPFRRSQLCTLCWPALLRRPLAVRSRLGPKRRRRRWPDSKK